jgi:hypothetical protein
MRKTSLAFLLAVGIQALAADDTSLSGKWQIQRSVGGNESSQECTLTQKDGDLNGTCSSDRGTVEISGKVTGKNVTFTYKGDSQGGPVTVVYKGTIQSPAKMTGTVAAIEFSIEGEFTAVRAK